MFLRADVVVDDGSPPAKAPEADVEIIARVEVAHQDPIGDSFRSRFATVSEERDHVVRAVEADVLDQIAEGHGIQLARVDHGRLRAQRDGQCEVSNPRKQIDDDVPRTHALGDPDSFGGVAGGEHDSGDIEAVSDACLHMDGFRLVPPEDADIGCPEGSVDARSILDDGPCGEYLREDPADRFAVLPRLRRKSKNHNVAEPLPLSGNRRLRYPRFCELDLQSRRRIRSRKARRQVDLSKQLGAIRCEVEFRRGRKRNEDRSIALRNLARLIEGPGRQHRTQELLRGPFGDLDRSSSLGHRALPR